MATKTKTKVTKPVVKKEPVKKVATTKSTNKKTAKASTTNKELEKMIATMNAAKKAKEKTVVVFTTNKSHHKANTNLNGFGASDLKPKLYEAYKYFLCEHDMTTKLVNMNEMSVEWIVKLK